ncbi:YdcF family protein [Paenibacillus tritici]|jgi:vancomycin permeability regulator SanA|uniref:YdcF family protein n=1 Tax=Paenibacillus tritici TaxID=1873425 RepID=A0ABX2DWJ6_9BACL|nr:YdcF family protein [Paenibacillus tritici]NQX48952.1 YdcF family protein [Paenibacillus tritici]QUL52473.1 YdcF family protein [Paenibacillus tritici]
MEWYVYKRGSSPIRKVSRKRHHPRRKRVLLVTLLVLVIAGLFWCGLVFNRINSAVTTSPMVKADAGVILGMSMWGDEPSPGLKERLDYGLELYRSGSFSHFVVSGGLDQPDYKYTEAEGMKRYLVAHGVPEKVIYLESQSTSTYENLLFSKKVLQEKGLSSTVIITHDFHGRRALETARELGYKNPQLGVTESKVMSMLKYKSREILAYTKWKFQQLSL